MPEENESKFDPIALAHAVAIDTAEDPQEVGEFVTSETLEGGVTDFRFATHLVGYEGWQWSVTMYHDEELDRWTVDECTLIPTEQALLPPKWIPWKDRLLPSDLSVTDSIGTEADDERLVDGLDTEEKVTVEETKVEEDGGSPEDVKDAIEDFELSRRHVMSELGKTQTAKRWYEGPHGPKSLSTKTADGKTCSTCGFFIPLKGELNRMFGVCANRWSPDDGRVVSLDHGCGEHSEIEPPELTSMWVQTKPAYDNVHIDILAQSKRDERADVELMEEYGEDSSSDVQDELEETAQTAESVVITEEPAVEETLTTEVPPADVVQDVLDDRTREIAIAKSGPDVQVEEVKETAEEDLADAEITAEPADDSPREDETEHEQVEQTDSTDTAVVETEVNDSIVYRE